jgi:hypothetical protein
LGAELLSSLKFEALPILSFVSRVSLIIELLTELMLIIGGAVGMGQTEGKLIRDSLGID